MIRFPGSNVPVLRKFWLLFAQACTLCLAVLFVVATLRPDLLPRIAAKNGGVVVLREAEAPPAAASGPATYADAAKKAMPAVVNIYTSKEVRSRNPLLDDAILLDLSMPGLDGEAAYAELRKVDGRVPVLLMSGYSEEEARSRFGAGDLAGFVAKPFTASELVAAVDQARRLARGPLESAGL